MSSLLIGGFGSPYLLTEGLAGAAPPPPGPGSPLLILGFGSPYLLSGGLAGAAPPPPGSGSPLPILGFGSRYLLTLGLAGVPAPILAVDLLAAIQDHFNADATLAGILGGLRLNRKARLGASAAPSNVGKTPYATVKQTGGNLALFTSSSETDTARICFRVYDPNAEVAAALCKLLAKSFNRAAFDYDGEGSSPMVQGGYTVGIENAWGVKSTPLSYVEIEFSTWVTTQRPL